MDKKPVQRFIPRLHVMFKAIKYNDLFRDQSPFFFSLKRDVWGHTWTEHVDCSLSFYQKLINTEAENDSAMGE